MTEELPNCTSTPNIAGSIPILAPITLTMAVLAVLVATVSLLGHRTHTEENHLKNEEVFCRTRSRISGPTTRLRIFAATTTNCSPT